MTPYLSLSLSLSLTLLCSLGIDLHNVEYWGIWGTFDSQDFACLTWFLSSAILVFPSGGHLLSCACRVQFVFKGTKVNGHFALFRYVLPVWSSKYNILIIFLLIVGYFSPSDANDKSVMNKAFKLTSYSLSKLGHYSLNPSQRHCLTMPSLRCMALCVISICDICCNIEALKMIMKCLKK